MDSKKSLRNILLLIPAFVLFVLACFQPLAGSHYFRQVQTAQTAAIYSAEDSINPLLPKVGFFGKPGYTVLEFPLYQMEATFLNKTLGIDITTSCRILSFLSAILVAFFLLEIYKLVFKSKLSLDLAALVLLSPLFLSLSHWASIEMTNLLFSVGAVYFLCRHIYDGNKIHDFFWFLIFTLLSLLLKPHGIFAIGFFILYLFFKNSKSKGFKYLLTSLVVLPAVYAWYSYGSKINTLYKNPFAFNASNTQYFQWNFSLDAILKLVARTFIYLIGPGTLLFLSAALIQNRKKFSGIVKAHKKILGIFLFSFFIYLLVFFRLNSAHNYYQLALVPLFFLGLSYLLQNLVVVNKKPLLVVALIINSLSSWYFLDRTDNDLYQMALHIKENITEGYEKKDIFYLTDTNNHAPFFSFYLKRYLDYLRTETKPANTESLITCEDYNSEKCMNYRKLYESSCSKTGTFLEKRWYCYLEK